MNLKPCPFCGATWGVGLTLGYVGQPAVGYYVHCQPCNLNGPMVESPQAAWEQAVEKWNVRTSLPEMAPLAHGTLVDRFLAWPLPDSVCSDQCATTKGYPHRTGTNLLTADEARQMIEYLFDRRRINGFRNPERRGVAMMRCRQHGGVRHRMSCDICNPSAPAEVAPK